MTGSSAVGPVVVEAEFAQRVGLPKFLPMDEIHNLLFILLDVFIYLYIEFLNN